FGSILTVDNSDAVTIAVLGAVIVVTVGGAGGGLFTILPAGEAARVAGLPVDALNLGLAALTAVTIVAGMRIVGVLLVAALLVLPLGPAAPPTRSFGATLLVASAVGAASATIGLAAAREWALAPGGTIV